jgi:hypothetical protein
MVIFSPIGLFLAGMAAFDGLQPLLWLQSFGMVTLRMMSPYERFSSL